MDIKNTNLSLIVLYFYIWRLNNYDSWSDQFELINIQFNMSLVFCSLWKSAYRRGRNPSSCLACIHRSASFILPQCNIPKLWPDLYVVALQWGGLHFWTLQDPGLRFLKVSSPQFLVLSSIYPIKNQHTSLVH